jgi:hypothetical protein
VTDYKIIDIGFLDKGVQLHSFSDNSGCVMLNSTTGETLSIEMSIEVLLIKIEEYISMPQGLRLTSDISSLYKKRFLVL